MSYFITRLILPSVVNALAEMKYLIVNFPSLCISMYVCTSLMICFYFHFNINFTIINVISPLSRLV